MDADILRGLPLSAASNRITVVSRKVIAPSGVDVRPGDLDITGCVCHLRVVDGITGEAWLVPLSPGAVESVRKSLAEYIPSNVTPIGG